MASQHTRRAALVALPLCLALLGGTAALPSSAFASTFSDVAGHWAESDGWIDYVQSNGLMKGYDYTDEFGPDNQITRAELAMVLYRMAGGTPTEAADFTDVWWGSWYYDAVAWCKANGIITGYPDGSFQPDRPVRRAELATMVYRFAKWKDADVSASDQAYYETEDTGLLDRPDTEFTYARTALVWTCDRGVLNGKFDDQGYAWLDVQSTATRGEAAKIFTVLKRDVIERSGSYTVTFKANGGSAVSTQKVASGSKATRPADPTRSGYTFVNWYSDASLTRVFNFYSNVTGNVTLYAKWAAATSSHELEAAEEPGATVEDERGAAVAANAIDAATSQAPQVTPGDVAADEVEEPGADENADDTGDADETDAAGDASDFDSAGDEDADVVADDAAEDQTPAAGTDEASDPAAA